MAGGALVTGGTGFAGRHLLAHLAERAQPFDAPSHADLDLLDAGAVRRTVRAARPGAVFHLAALASVTRSWEEPATTLRQNIEMTLNVLDAVRREAPDAAVVVASSGEVYGRPDALPVDEGAALRPQNPYATSKAACDLLGGQFADVHGLRVVRTRAFNQAGPGQSDQYVLGTFTRQVAAAELAGQDEVVIRTGNTDSARDFTDVRDVVRAYAAAVELPAGVYNVCSGRAVSVIELLDLIGQCTRLQVRHELDADRVRAHDVKEIRGSPERFRRLTGWQPEIPLKRTVQDAVQDWRRRLEGGQAPCNG